MNEIKFVVVKLFDQDHKAGRKFMVQALDTDANAAASVAAVTVHGPGTHWETTWRLMDDDGNPAT